MPWAQPRLVSWLATLPVIVRGFAEGLWQAGRTEWLRVVKVGMRMVNLRTFHLSYVIRVQWDGGKKAGRRASSRFGVGEVSYSYQLYDPQDTLSGVHSLRCFVEVGGEAVGDPVCDHWAEWVDTHKKRGHGGRGHTKDRAREVEEEGSSPQPKRPKKEPSQRGRTGDIPMPPPPPPPQAKCQDSLTGAVGVG